MTVTVSRLVTVLFGFVTAAHLPYTTTLRPSFTFIAHAKHLTTTATLHTARRPAPHTPGGLPTVDGRKDTSLLFYAHPILNDFPLGVFSLHTPPPIVQAWDDVLF